MQVIRATTLPLSRWPNGAGRKADILAGDGWLISFAWLDANAPFSHLADMDRTITLVEGPGFTLDVAGTALPVTTPFAPTRFDGAADTRCRITGPCRVLNVMTDRTRFRHTVTILDRSQPIDPARSLVCVVVALDGTLQVGTEVLDRLDAVSIVALAELSLVPGRHAACIKIDDP